jgi:hypothetical protein
MAAAAVVGWKREKRGKRDEGLCPKCFYENLM